MVLGNAGASSPRFLLRVVGRFGVRFSGVPADLVEDVAGVVGEAGEAVAQGLQRDGQAVVLVLAEAGTDEQGQQFEVITQLDEIQLGLFFQQIDHAYMGHGDLHFFVEESRRA